MAIDVDTENLVTLNQATKLIPGTPTIGTLQRWRSEGVRGRRLETLLVGGIRYTSREAITRFLSAPETPPTSTLARPKAPSRPPRLRKAGAAT